MPKVLATTELTEVLATTRQKQIANSRYWHILLHYKKTLFGWESEVDSPEFFLSPEGKTDPEKELEATIRRFFAENNLAEDAAAQCRFIARFEFLNDQLQLVEHGLKKNACEKYHTWIDDIDAESISLIFPSFYLETPASMFGHTLLRVDSKKNQPYPLLSQAINYAAMADESQENPIKYLVYGLFGGYPGFFTMMPYYLKVQEYNDIELRDIWEYQLNLTPTEIRKMLTHLWELDVVYFDYFFFKENCSYQLLSILEAARPSLHLQEKFHWWAIPAETIRVIAAVPGLVVQRTYRPSRWSKILQKMTLLSNTEKEIFYAIIEQQGWENIKTWNSVAKEKKALILETVNEYYVFKGTPEARELRKKILLERASLRIISPNQPLPEMSTPPEEGHETSRIGFAVGSTSQGKSFGEVELRASFHDAMANDHGFLPNSQIEALRFKARYFGEDNRAVLEEFTVLDVSSKIPRHRLQPKLSWKFKTGAKQLKSHDCLNCPVLYFEGGLGVSYAIPNGVYYSFMELRIHYGEELEQNYQAGAGLTFGVLHQWGDIGKTNLVFTHVGFEFGEKDSYQIYTAQMSFFLSTNTEIRFEGLKNKGYWESSLAFKLYF